MEQKLKYFVVLMLTIISILLFSVFILPLLLISILIGVGYFFILSLQKKKYSSPVKPKGTIEILPAEKSDEELETMLDVLQKKAKDKSGKDKFRDIP